MPQDPNFTRGTGRLTTDRFDFEKHLNGTDFRHDGYQIDLDPPVDIQGTDYTTVSEALDALAAILSPESTPAATTTTQGIVKLAKDLGGTADLPVVIGLQGRSVSTLSPTTDDVLAWNGINWAPAASNSAFIAANDLAGTNVSQNVVAITGSGGAIPVKSASLSYSNDVVNPTITQASTSLIHGNPLTIKAQASTGTNLDGGTLVLSGGAKNGSGVRGGVQLKMNGAADTLLQLVEPVTGQRVLGLVKNGVVNSTDMPSNTGDMVVYVANTATPPTSGVPSNGTIMYAEGGILKVKQSDGTTIIIGSIPNPSVWGPTGAQTTTRQYTFATTNGTQSIAATFALSDNASTKLDVLVVGRKTTTDAESAQFNMTMGYVRFGGGAPSALGTVTNADPRATSGASGWAATITVSDNDANVEVTGQGSTNINWFIIIQAMIIS